MIKQGIAANMDYLHVLIFVVLRYFGTAFPNGTQYTYTQYTSSSVLVIKQYSTVLRSSVKDYGKIRFFLYSGR